MYVKIYEPGDILTIYEAAMLISFYPSELEALAKNGSAPRRMVNNVPFFSRQILTSWLEANPHYARYQVTPYEGHDLLTVAQAAEFLKVSPKTIRSEVKNHKIPHQLVEDKPTFSRWRLLEWLGHESLTRTHRTVVAKRG